MESPSPKTSSTFRRVLSSLVVALVSMPAVGAVAARGDVAESVAGAAVIRWHAAESEGDARYVYHEELLRLALERTRAEYGDYAWETVRGMSQARQVASLADGRLTVLLQPASADYEARFCAVKIPLDKGLLGYRVLMVRREDLDKFAAVRTPEDLRRFTVGQGAGWLDSGVWSANGVNPVVSASYEGMFRMLEARRFDFLSRGVSQAVHEMDRQSPAMPTLCIEPTLCIHYPWPRYFYCRDTEAGRRLAARLEKGLREVMADRSVFEPLFNRHHAEALRRLNLPGRRLLRLSNPALPPGTPADEPPSWLSPLMPTLAQGS